MYEASGREGGRDGERYMIIKKKYVKRGDLKFEMNCFTSSTIIEVN